MKKLLSLSMMAGICIFVIAGCKPATQSTSIKPSIIDMSQMQMQRHLESLGYVYYSPAWDDATNEPAGIYMWHDDGMKLSCIYRHGKLVSAGLFTGHSKTWQDTIQTWRRIEPGIVPVAEYSYQYATPALGLIAGNPVAYRDSYAFVWHDKHKSTLLIP